MSAASSQLYSVTHLPFIPLATAETANDRRGALKLLEFNRVNRAPWYFVSSRTKLRLA